MQSFDYYLNQLHEVGVVTKVNNPIVTVQGLPLCKPRELVLFETGQFGEIYTVNRDSFDVLVFSAEPLRPGTKAVRTNKTLTVPVGKELLGQVIDPLGKPINALPAGQPPNYAEEREIDTKAPGISRRVRIQKPFSTGTILIDMMVPLGKGQKELIIGDRKTGKSSFVMTTIMNQIAHGAVAIYAAIGKKRSDIRHLQDTMINKNLSSKFVIVATSSNDSPSLIYLTPFTAMTIAEYFRDQGEDVLLVLDDLSTHARFLREISLIAKNFPGRDSYPGDIFYTQARLLERAGNFKNNVSITCLPIVETIDSDLTGYIPTTLMGITDGHIFFDSNIFYKGRRPAVNIALSVTRVGKQAQTQVKRDITREVTAYLSLYERVLNLSHFGSELTENVKNIIGMGEKIYDFFNQEYTMLVPEEVQLILFSLLWLRLIEVNKQQMNEIKKKMIQSLENKDNKLLFDEIFQANNFNELLKNVSLNKDKIIALWQ